ncbi:MAG: hypothetical protein AB7T49_21345 [Oligoflexales bacterium]|nr:hypothetical protein [Nitrosomonas nitrosa]
MSKVFNLAYYNGKSMLGGILAFIISFILQVRLFYLVAVRIVDTGSQEKSGWEWFVIAVIALGMLFACFYGAIEGKDIWRNAYNRSVLTNVKMPLTQSILRLASFLLILLLIPYLAVQVLTLIGVAQIKLWGLVVKGSVFFFLFSLVAVVGRETIFSIVEERHSEQWSFTANVFESAFRAKKEESTK